MDAYPLPRPPCDLSCTAVGRSVIGLCAVVGLTVGGYIPVLWGASAFGLTSLLFGAIGGIAGVWVGARLSDY